MKMPGRLLLVAAMSAVGIPSLATPIAAQEVPDRNHLYDTWQFSVAGSLVIFDTSIRVDSEDGSIGTEIDTESDLGLDEAKLQPRLTGRWRPGRRHELELGYQFAQREASHTLSRDIEFADTAFTAGADVRASLDADNVFLTYRFALVTDERQQFGLGVGLGAILQDTKIQALLSASSGGGSRSVDYEAQESVTAPTASIGAYGRFRLGDAWYLEADLRGIYIAFDRFEARLFEPAAGVRWFPWERFGFEGAWSGQLIRVDIDPVEGDGVIDEVGGRFEYFNQTVRLGALFTP